MSPDLTDILAVPLEGAAVMKRKTKRITGARDLTADDYAEMLWEDKRRKKEIEEQKQKRKEVREQKKKEKEARIEAGLGRGKGHGRGKGKEKAAVVQSSESESDALSDVDMITPRHTPTSSAGEISHKRGKGRWKGKQKAAVVRSSESKESDALSDESDALSDVDMLAPRQIPSCFRCNSESEENDGTICVLCVSIMTQKGYQEA